jgi:hypothetical protein
MALQIRRGLNRDRKSFVPAIGELIYTTDTDLIYVGDGVTPGGILVSGQESVVKNFSSINANSFIVRANDINQTMSFLPANGVTITANPNTNTITIGFDGTSILYETAANITLINANIAYLNAVNSVQNTTINTLSIFAQAAFNEANTAQFNAVYTQSINSYQNTLISSVTANTTALQGGLNTANVNITYIQGVDLTQNTNITNVDVKTQAAFDKANTASSNTIALQGGLNTANANIAYILGVDLAQNTSITNLQGGLNTANANIAYILGVDLTQNTNITNVDTKTQSAFDKANSANVLAQSAFDKANTASSNTIALQGGLNTANVNIAYIYGVNDSQNTTIGTKFNSSGGTISGSVVIQQNLTVEGNVSYTGNVTSITVTGNTGQFFGYAANGFNALYAGIPVGYLVEPQIVTQFSSNFDGYSGLNMQNINSGPNASFDLFLTADNGTPLDGFVDLGIASSNYNYSGYSLIGKNDGYLFSHGNTSTGGGNMIIGTALNNDIIFTTGGLETQNAVMRIGGTSGANTVRILSNIRSTSVTSGALQIKGGLGVTGNVYAENLYSGGSLVLTSEPIGTLASSNTIYLQGGLNTANANIAYILGVDLTQNTSITNIETKTQSAFDKANSANVLAQSAFDKANTFSITANTGQLTANVSTGNVALGLANVNSNIGTFGGATSIPVITLDGFGRVTSSGNVTVNIPQSSTITVLDDISNRFDGIERTFGLYSDGSVANVTAPEQLLVQVGGIVLPPFINTYDVVFGSGFISFTKGYNIANVTNVTYITFASAPQINMDCVMRVIGQNQIPQIKKYPLSPISIMIGY